MDPIKTIGRFLKGGEERDAIHIAVLPVVAGEELRPGDRIRLAWGSSNIAIKAQDEYNVNKSLGIVDPFLSDWRVKEGTRFWMFLHPNTVTGMHHHWQHPDIDNPPKPANDSEAWLRRFAERWGFHYESMIEAAQTPGEYITAYGHDLHSRSQLGDDYDLFWQHLAVLTGRTFDAEYRKSIGWSCSC